MSNRASILFVVPPENEQAFLFATSLKEGLPERDITITTAGLTSLLFEIRRYDLAHFFVPAGTKTAQFVKKIGGKTKFVQTLLTQPESGEEYKNVIFGDGVIAFSSHAKQSIEGNHPGIEVDVIPPCLRIPDPTSLQPGNETRDHYSVGEKMLVVALSDVRSKKDFDAFLYITREYNRREIFRLLIPHYRKDKETELWRSRIQYSIDMEKLECATLLDQSDFHSLIDAADVAIYIERRIDEQMEFPIAVLEALLRGKPLLCFDRPPVNEVIRNFKSNWVANNIEDFVRETRDIQKEEDQLEEISTELTRYCKNILSVDKVAAQYNQLYNRLLTT